MRRFVQVYMELPNPNLEQIQVLEAVVASLMKNNDKNLSQIRALDSELRIIKKALEEKTDCLSEFQLSVEKMVISQRVKWALHLLFSSNESFILVLMLVMVLKQEGGELEPYAAFVALMYASVKRVLDLESNAYRNGIGYRLGNLLRSFVKTGDE